MVSTCLYRLCRYWSLLQPTVPFFLKAVASFVSTLSAYEWHREICGGIEDSRGWGLDLVVQPNLPSNLISISRFMFFQLQGACIFMLFCL
ncbi:hypothetical protein PAHAL_2G422800 [Panicum hallii]|uniref:Uncharacterized protein n=1 Tax=Panicum hallii TaxID=206008 RepID=A0A2S3H3V4_9POAL|nr:hypothetical protein PAHAL_2G422800 [Panicum hallii]